MKALRFATIGAWGHGPHVLRQLAPLAGQIDLVACATAVPEDDPRAWARDHPQTAGAPLYDDPRLMLQEVRPDVVIISARLDRIAPLAIEAARFSCHLVCEKPLAITHESLRELHQAVRSADVQCVAMLDNRDNPALAAARKAIEQGQIGNVVLCNARKSYKWGSRPEWFGTRRLYGGTIPWIGIHALDFIHAAAGGRFTAVSALHGNAAHPQRPGCEDHASLLLEMAGGVRATASIDYLRPASAPTHGDDWIRIVGTRGIIEAHMARNVCTLVADNQPPCELPPGADVPTYAGIFRGLREDPAALAGDTARSFTLTHAALCARDAADQRRWVAIEQGPWD